MTRPTGPDRMDRREFLVGAVAIPTAASIDGLDSIAPSSPPARVGSTEIAQVRDSAIAVKRGDMRWGGGFGFDAALVETRWARDLLDARCSERLRPELLTAVGWLACNTGFMAFDNQRYRDASRLWTLASRCAEQAGNWSLQARVLGSMARQATWLDRPDDGLHLVQRALDGDHGQLVPTELAMLWALRARACAVSQDVPGAEQAIGTADQWFAARNIDECDDRPWVVHYNHEHHWGDTGMAWHHIAVSESDQHALVEATGRHQAAADGHRVASARSHALSLSALARLETTAGDLDHGIAVGHLAIDASQQVRSGRVREELLGLYHSTEQHKVLNDVAALRERIVASLLAA